MRYAIFMNIRFIGENQRIKPRSTLCSEYMAAEQNSWGFGVDWIDYILNLDLVFKYTVVEVI